MNDTTCTDLVARAILPLPRFCAELPVCGGAYKTEPDDFQVEEVPAYLPADEGEHLFLWVEKRGLATPQLTRELSHALDVTTHEIGTAGLKDADAVTRQFVSVPGRCRDKIAGLAIPNVKILSSALHRNKLRTGHLHGNRFRIRLRAVANPSAAPALIEKIQQQGLVNFYGPQRFGHGGQTVRMGLELFARSQAPAHHHPSRTMRRLALSAVQSALFNEYLKIRLAQGLLQTALAGDVFLVRRSGGPFTSEDLPREQARIQAREIVPSGPMFGPKMRQPLADAAALEAQILKDVGMEPQDFAGFGQIMEGTRRPVLIYAEDLKAEVDGDTVTVECVLPSGSYATVLLHELGAHPATEQRESVPEND